MQKGVVGMKILVINGPNINMVGIREKGIYGERTYEDLLRQIQEKCDRDGIDVEFFQSNTEGFIVDKIQEVYGKKDGIIINPAAYTHTSVAILDALKAVSIPTIEVHLSDINSREEFRKHSYVSMYAAKTICGKGFDGYLEAVDCLKEMYK